MEENRSMLILLLILAGIAFLFHLIGFFGPGWLVFELIYNPNYQSFTGHGSVVGGGGYGQYGQYGSSYGTGGNYGGSYGNNYGGSYGGNYPNTGGSYGQGGYGYNQGGTGNWGNSYGTPFVNVDMKAGLWAFHCCIRYDPQREDCKMTLEKIRNSIGLSNSYHIQSNSGQMRTGVDGIFEEMTRQKVLATIALLLALLGLLGNILLFTPIMGTGGVKRVLCAILWLLSIIFVLAAVGVQGKEISDTKNEFKEYDQINPGKYRFEPEFPWALLVFGFGSLFALINAVLVLFLLPRCIQSPEHEHERGYYSETPMNEKI